MKIQKLAAAAAMGDGSEKLSNGLSLSLSRGNLVKPAVSALGPASAETLLAAARLKHILGTSRKLVVFSCFGEKDGGSILTAKTAAALAEIAGGNVLILDVNRVSSQMPRLFGLTASPGLHDVLEDRADWKNAVQQLAPSNLSILPLGTGTLPLAPLLAGAQASALMAETRASFRYVLVDAGLVQSPENMLMASLSDGVVVGLAAGQRRRDEITTYQAELRRLQIPLLGALLTVRESRK